jgi:hypothetical protein
VVDAGDLKQVLGLERGLDGVARLVEQRVVEAEVLDEPRAGAVLDEFVAVVCSVSNANTLRDLTCL